MDFIAYQQLQIYAKEYLLIRNIPTFEPSKINMMILSSIGQAKALKSTTTPALVGDVQVVHAVVVTLVKTI